MSNPERVYPIEKNLEMPYVFWSGECKFPKAETQGRQICAGDETINF
jgi:hypothetical protein